MISRLDFAVRSLLARQRCAHDHPVGKSLLGPMLSTGFDPIQVVESALCHWRVSSRRPQPNTFVYVGAFWTSAIASMSKRAGERK